MVLNALTVDVEEYYHGVEFGQALGTAVTRLPSRVVPQTERLLDLLDRHRTRGTFFTLGVVAERHPRIVRAIAERGHELASHGWDHTPVWALGADGFRVDLRRARRALEQASGRSVRGYRAPNYSIRPDTLWAFPILAEEGFAYDSSVYPVVHDRYGFPDAPRFAHVVARRGGAELWEVPVGTARFAGTNLPFGGGFLRLLPLPLVRGAVASINRVDRRPAVLYVHPWELDPGQPRPAMPWRHRVRHYAGLATAEGKLDRLLAEFRFTSIERAVEPLASARTTASAARAS